MNSRVFYYSDQYREIYRTVSSASNKNREAVVQILDVNGPYIYLFSPGDFVAEILQRQLRQFCSIYHYMKDYKL